MSRVKVEEVVHLITTALVQHITTSHTSSIALLIQWYSLTLFIGLDRAHLPSKTSQKSFSGSFAIPLSDYSVVRVQRQSPSVESLSVVVVVCSSMIELYSGASFRRITTIEKSSLTLMLSSFLHRTFGDKYILPAGNANRMPQPTYLLRDNGMCTADLILARNAIIATLIMDPSTMDKRKTHNLVGGSMP